MPPYELPRKLEPDLARVLAYWEGLRRAENNMPFWDDVNLSALPDILPRLMLFDVFERPVRFRLATVGTQIKATHGPDVEGKFLDEVEFHDPLRYLLSQCSATVESGAPTYFRSNPRKHDAGRSAEQYSRLILPMWGGGHIAMLLGGIA